MKYELIAGNKRKLNSINTIDENYINTYRLNFYESELFYDAWFYKGKFECIQEISYELPYLDLCNLHNIYFYRYIMGNEFVEVFKVDEDYYVDFYGKYLSSYFFFFASKNEFKFNSKYWHRIKYYYNRKINKDYYTI